MTRADVTRAVVAARLAAGLTWQELADRLGKPVVWVTAALLGQHPLSGPDAQTIVDALDLPAEAAAVLCSVPVRGADVQQIPTDPTMYRFHEALLVYGGALKEVLHEKFGDGIMSAINFSVAMDKKSNETGDRVVITFDGKFLPYDWTGASDD